MAIVYKSIEQILIEIKKIMLETKTTQREIADKLGIKPQGLTKILNKKNFSFEDAQKILNTMGYDLVIDFKQSNGFNPYSLTSQPLLDEAKRQLERCTETGDFPD